MASSVVSHQGVAFRMRPSRSRGSIAFDLSPRPPLAVSRLGDSEAPNPTVTHLQTPSSHPKPLLPERRLGALDRALRRRVEQREQSRPARVVRREAPHAACREAPGFFDALASGRMPSPPLRQRWERRAEERDARLATRVSRRVARALRIDLLLPTSLPTSPDFSTPWRAAIESAKGRIMMRKELGERAELTTRIVRCAPTARSLSLSRRAPTARVCSRSLAAHRSRALALALSPRIDRTLSRRP